MATSPLFSIKVCGPTVYRACGTNMYVNGYCFLLDQNLQQLQRFPESLPGKPNPVGIKELNKKERNETPLGIGLCRKWYWHGVVGFR